MFDDVGKEIKGIAEGYVWGKAIRYALVGVVVTCAAVYLLSESIGAAFMASLLAAAVCGAVGYSAGKRDALMFYACGEVVDRVISLERKLSGDCERQTAKVKKVKVTEDEVVYRPVEKVEPADMEGAPVLARFSNGMWKCAWCDHLNPAEAEACGECGVVPKFE